VRAGGETGEELIDDTLLHREVMRVLADRKPRVLFVGYGDSDARAHAGDRARYLAATRDADRFIGEIWRAMQAVPEYHAKTTLVVTTDHGRGRGRQWSSHGWNTRGSSETWLAIVGPDTPALGERRDTETTTAQVAATIAALLGLDYRAAIPRAAPAIPSH
jgi:arylsulfatase A-like enzyme